MKLVEAIQRIQYEESWGIWAEVPFASESEARFGQVQFEHLGLLDDKVFFADGVTCGNYITVYCEGIDCLEEFGDEAAREMIAEVEED